MCMWMVMQLMVKVMAGYHGKIDNSNVKIDIKNKTKKKKQGFDHKLSFSLLIVKG